jgi:hypothetical protein
MNLQSLIVVALRLMALHFLLRTVIVLLLEVIHVFNPGDPVWIVFPAIILFGMAGATVLLWVLAVPIARRVTRNVPQDLSFGSMSLADCYSIAFIGIGLYYVTAQLPEVLNMSHYMFREAALSPGLSWREAVNFYEVSSTFIPFIVGILLFVKGRSWGEGLAQRQRRTELN